MKKNPFQSIDKFTMKSNYKRIKTRFITHHSLGYFPAKPEMEASTNTTVLYYAHVHLYMYTYLFNIIYVSSILQDMFDVYK